MRHHGWTGWTLQTHVRQTEKQKLKGTINIIQNALNTISKGKFNFYLATGYSSLRRSTPTEEGETPLIVHPTFVDLATLLMRSSYIHT